MERIPVEVEEVFTKPNGTLGKRVLFSYVVLLCESGGSEVKALRLDNMAIRKEEIMKKIYKELQNLCISIYQRRM